MLERCANTCFESLNGLLHKLVGYDEHADWMMKLISYLDWILSKTLPILALISQLKVLNLSTSLCRSQWKQSITALLYWIRRILTLLLGLCESQNLMGPTYRFVYQPMKIWCFAILKLGTQFCVIFLSTNPLYLFESYSQTLKSDAKNRTVLTTCIQI